MSRGLVCAMVVSVLASITPAHADDYFTPHKSSSTVVAQIPRARTSSARLLIGGLLAGAVIATGIGAYYNLDSRSAADAVSSRTPTGKIWTADEQATYDRIHASGVKAGIGYGVAGAFAIGALIAYWRTDPGEEQIEYKPQALIAPTAGGAIVGATWGF